jgi:tetratricopeptide (TPR) repeat protein
MNKRRKYIFILTVSIICIAVLITILKFASGYQYRSILPDLPDLQGSPAVLTDQITEASKKAHRNPSSDNLGRLGMVYHSSAYYDQASQCYKLAIKKNNSEWIWSYYLGYLNTEMGESNSAIENFRAVIKVNPEVHLAWYYVGEGYENLGSGYKAEVAFEKVANLQEMTGPEKTSTRNDYFPLRAYAMFQLARIYLNTNRVDLAEKTLIQVLQFHRSFGSAYRLLGNAYRLKGDSTLSKYNIVRANDLADYTPPVDTLIDKLALLSKSELYLLKQIDVAEKGVYPEWALVIANNGLKQLPDNRYLISKAIKLFLRLDFGKQAVPYLDRHINLYKEDFVEIKEVADLLSEKGLISQALIYFNLASKLKPEDPDIQSSLALCLWNGGMKQNASEQMSEFLNKNITRTEILSSGVSYFILTGEREKAVGYLDKLRTLSPQSPVVKKYSGMIAENDGKIIEAITLYESAFKGDPADMSAIRYLGNLLIKQKMWEKAIIHYRKALQYHPNEPDFLERLGTLFVSCPNTMLRDYKSAKEFSERAFIHTGCPAEVIVSAAKSLSEAYWALGDRRNATTFINIALSLAKNQNAPKEYIAELEKKVKLFSSSN